MLVTKTFCKPGSLIYIVPTGLLVSLHYDAHGDLAQISSGFISRGDTNYEALPEDFVRSVISGGLIPGSIQITGGTTIIWGVFYSDVFKAAVGDLPQCEYDRIVKDITTGNIKYHFYIGNVDSGAAAISNPTSLNAWGRMAGFDILPTWLIPTDATDLSLREYVASDIHYPFKYPLISGYVVYEGALKPYFYPINLRTATVTHTTRYVNHSGYYRYKVQYGDSDELIMNYPDAAFFNVQKGSQLIMDGDAIIWCNTKSSDHSNRLPKQVVCKSCGKILEVPDVGYMSCSNPQCTSLLYPRIDRFCKVLGLETISKSQFDTYVGDSQLQIFPDMLLLPEYKSSKIKCYLWELIYACLPMEVGLDKQWLIKFCNHCNNSYPTIKYYFDNPIKIYTELDMNVSRRLADWLSSPYNILELANMVKSEQLEILAQDKIMKFDGAPIFRNKTICITGTFRHGTLAEIQAILESYSATVVTEFDGYIQCVLVGDIKDGIDGSVIVAARELNIPIFDESDFFNKYEIDEDLEKYLL